MPTRSLLLATLLFFTYSSHGQNGKKHIISEKTNIEKQPRFSFGPIAGASFSNGKVTYYNANIATEMLIKFRFGGVAEYAVSRKLFVQSGNATRDKIERRAEALLFYFIQSRFILNQVNQRSNSIIVLQTS